ncbi:galactose mutarotase-like domain-containing protein [Blastocladiella britannica]|nr:galactose mutarotase-like domain-containing protein [Blastocladiella britannica]
MTWLLHTYLRVPSIEGTAVRGLGGSTYSDKTRSLAAFQQVGDLTVSEEVDRVFAGVVPATSKPVAVFHSGAHVVTVDRVAGPATGHSFADVVVWNPWIEKAKGMADFDNEGYKSMICVEVGDVAKTVSVAPGQVREAGQVLWAASAVSGAPKL